MDICIPGYLRIFHHQQGHWQHIIGDSFYNPEGEPPDLEFATRKYDISREDLAIELFRANDGRAGYCIGDLKQKRFYYCGVDVESVREKLRSLGIGRSDPMESQ
ncbi:hypothetical protein [Nostoc sp. CHAB 5715]|uniref:hypothetical protein n=1 Tax=Nostoc sp. CHAB 5715 TaxID=2780400 RepID=UPI001E47E268|nr:hypothetical protein [Nostoc sp. CHAB 5715]MCC5625181.1 hypothetical protein [Nostoc sp. CHAB 5715]